MKGERGMQGPVGPKGDQGQKGDSASQGGPANLASHLNWKECTFTKVDHRDTGEIYVSCSLTNITTTT